MSAQDQPFPRAAAVRGEPIGGLASAHAAHGDDPLLACLEFIAHDFGKPVSRAAVVSGLPLRGDRLSVDLVPRAAARLGLVAKLVKRRVRQIPGLVVPFIVLFKSGDACVVVRKEGRSGRVRVVFPGVSQKVRTYRLRRMERECSGYVFYVTAQADTQSVVRERDPQRRARGHWLWSAVRRFWPSWSQIVLTAFVINVLGLATPLFVMNVYNRVIPNMAIPTLWALSAGVVIALLFDVILRQLRAFVLDITGRRVDMKVAASLYEHALGISMAKRPASSGAVANQIREFETVRDFFTSSSIIAATDFLFVGVFIAVLWMIVGPIAYVSAIAVPLVILATLLIQVPLSRSVRQTQSEAARRHAILVEGLLGVETIKSVGGEGIMQRRWEDAVAATARANSSSKFWSTLALNLTAFATQAVSIINIVWGVFLIGAGEITIGALIAANILTGRILAPLSNIALTLARAQQAFTALRELTEFMQLEREREGQIGSGDMVQRGEVEFRNVSLTYPGGSAPALKDVSFAIRAGEHVGLVGRIGSGKSSIGRLLACLYEPDSGAVLVDGVNALRYEPADLRAGVAYVSQDVELFTGTLRDNIALGRPNASEEEIAEAARVAGVDAFIATHPLGLGMLLGERGKGLSGGQRQAVGLARALLRRPRVLFLDEPSSAMDTATEQALIRNLRDYLTSGQTLIVSTHRVSVLELVDRLIVLDGGRVVADGPKGAVLKALQGDGGGPRQISSVAAGS